MFAQPNVLETDYWENTSSSRTFPDIVNVTFAIEMKVTDDVSWQAIGSLFYNHSVLAKAEEEMETRLAMNQLDLTVAWQSNGH